MTAAALALAAALPAAVAEAPPAAPRRFLPLPGQRIVFNGDSMFNGYGTGSYTDPTPLRTVHRILDLLLRENVPRPPAIVRLPAVWRGLNADGNLVMALAIGASLGGDVGNWRLDPVAARFQHPETGGDLPRIWGFARDPDDRERLALVEELRRIVVREAGGPPPAAAPAASGSERRPGAGGPTAHTWTRLLRHGRVLDHPARQPEGTTRPASSELGKLFQLDRERLLLVASLREQGGHDFEIGNDGFIFRELSEVVPERVSFRCTMKGRR